MQRRSRQNGQHSNNVSQHTPQNPVQQHNLQHNGSHHNGYNTRFAQPSEHSHTDNTSLSGTVASSSAVNTGHGLSHMEGADSTANAPNLSLLPEHAFHQSYNAAFAAFSTNPEYAAQGNYVNSGNDQGLNVILQYASNSGALGNNMDSSHFPSGGH